MHYDKVVQEFEVSNDLRAFVKVVPSIEHAWCYDDDFSAGLYLQDQHLVCDLLITPKRCTVCRSRTAYHSVWCTQLLLHSE